MLWNNAPNIAKVKSSDSQQNCLQIVTYTDITNDNPVRYINENKNNYFQHVKPEKYSNNTESVIHNPAYGEVILKRKPKNTAFFNSHSL